MLTCRLCNEPLPAPCEAAFDPDTSVPGPSYLHVGCAKKERDRLAGEAYANRARLDGGAPKLLRACERAYRSTCATMGPQSDLARELADAIHAATGAYPPVPQVKGRFTL
jgi:hypothetical protein